MAGTRQCYRQMWRWTIARVFTPAPLSHLGGDGYQLAITISLLPLASLATSIRLPPAVLSRRHAGPTVPRPGSIRRETFVLLR